MLGSLIIVFREVIEAGLILGIVLAVTQGVHGSRATIVAGVVAGVIGALLVAAFAGVIANALAGMGQEIFNASILLVAVVMLIWHNVWMASHGRELAAEVKRVGDAVRTGSRSIVALGVVCAVAVMREGSEVALFMYGLVASGGSTTSELLAGSILGLLGGAAVTAVTYLGLLKIPPRRLFAVTTVLISFLAAGLAAQAVRFLQQASVGTALPESVVTFVAVIFGETAAQKEIGVGAALGGPLVLGTITYAAVGLVFLASRKKQHKALLAGIDTRKLSRDQAWFMGIFVVKVALGVVAFTVKPWLGILFVAAYALYVWEEMRRPADAGRASRATSSIRIVARPARPGRHASRVS